MFGDILGRLWNGEVPLWKSFWIYTVVVGQLLMIPLKIMNQVGIANMSPLWKGIMLVYSLSTLAYLGFILIAVWKSSDNFKGHYMWRLLAKLVVISGMAQWCSSIIDLFGIVTKRF